MKPVQSLDHTKTLDELEGEIWGEPSYDSRLVTTVHRLRKKRVGDFTVEDLRIMIGQGVGVRWLVPLVLDVLEESPLVSGDFYSGDLLASVLMVDRSFWEREWEVRLRAVVGRLDDVPKELEELIAGFRSTG